MYSRWESACCAAITLAMVGCTDVSNAPAGDPSAKLDETSFRCKVQPILARQCSYNACHGNAGAALRVYTPGKLRATPPANTDDANAALTADEQHANFQSAAGFSLANPNPADNWLLLKPLPASWGGFEHKGGAIYSGADDPQFTTISSWLGGSLKCN